MVDEAALLVATGSHPTESLVGLSVSTRDILDEEVRWSMGGVRESPLLLLMKHGGVAEVKNRLNMRLVCLLTLIKKIGRTLGLINANVERKRANCSVIIIRKSLLPMERLRNRSVLLECDFAANILY